MALVGYDPNKKTPAQRPPRARRATFRLLEQAITASKARSAEAQSPGQLCLIPLVGGELSDIFLVKETETVLGRQRTVDLRVRDGKASRQHCKILLTEDGAIIADMGSSNGTFVNGVRVEQHRLSDGDLIGLGETVLRARYMQFEGPSDTDAYWFATRDEGSALYNRTYLLEALKREVALASRWEHPLALLLVGLDLEGVSGESRRRLLNMEMRALGADFLREGGDGLLISRYSAAEVAVLAPMLSAAEAASLCEQILLERTSSVADNAGAGLAVFAGLADLPAGADSVEQLLHHAEVALYQARAKQSASPEIYTG